MSQLEKDGWPSQVQSNTTGGESCGAGVTSGGPESAPQPGGLGRVPAAHESAARGPGGCDRNGAQAGTDRLPSVEARADVRASESGGVRGPNEGEAAQGVEAEGTPVGAGDNRENVGRRSNGSRRFGAGIKEEQGIGSGGPEGGGEEHGSTRKNTQSDRPMAMAGENARRGEPGRKIISVRSASRRGWVLATEEDWPDCNAPFGDPDRRAQGCPPQRSAPTGPSDPFSLTAWQSGPARRRGSGPANLLAVAL